ncbi:MAG: sulfotransferase domain-containing protein [Burkholderiales bacterium]|nr:sulfotransferase domain-containing protein [Burkholderiales bacterium]
MADRPPAQVEPKLEADTYVLSYPKSGRTWMRALLGKALVDHYHLSSSRLLELEEVTRLAGLPVATFYHDGSAMLDGLSWRDLRSDKSEYRDKRVLLLGRDVRDTLVSAYFHATRRLRFFTGTISAFVRDERYGVDKVLAFYRHWHAARQFPRAFMFVRYEAMHADPAGILGRVLQFIGTPDVPAATTAAAADFARFENLRDAEARNLFDNPMLATRPNADPEAFKVRRGKIGGFRDHLSADDVAWIDACEAERGCEFTRPAA